MLQKWYKCLILFVGIEYITSESCTTARNTTGECIPIKQCDVLLNIFKLRTFNDNFIKYLHQSQCGYEGASPKVCCELNVKACETDSDEPGFCTPLNACKTLSGNGFDLTKCDGKTGLQLCCPLIIHEAVPNLLPGEDRCGYFNDIHEIIAGGSETKIYEYPWMVLLEYENNNEVRLNCAGTLINRRYVLTAAHCTTGPAAEKYGKLVRVRLGEYDTNSENDCDSSQVCSNPIVRVDIESIINHEDYDLKGKSDIALIRMKEKVEYSDFISPICLPKSPLTLPPNLTVVGWGYTEYGQPSNLKLELVVPLFDKEKCTQFYSRANFPIDDKQICAGGEYGRDSCSGDRGGPLMTNKVNIRNQWFQVGIVSFGPKPCGQYQKPAVYTLVWRYIDWITSKLKP